MMITAKRIAGALFATAALALAACSGGAPKPAEGDIALGAAEGAKVTVVEYASPTCPHCAAWQEQVWPAFKAKYVDTNKVRYVFREIPTDPLQISTAAILLARCSGPDKYLDVIHKVMASQKSWREGADPAASLVTIAKGAGLSQSQYQACITDPKGIAALETRIRAAGEAGVIGTPTFFVNTTTVVSPGAEGATLADLSAAIDAELAKP